MYTKKITAGIVAGFIALTMSTGIASADMSKPNTKCNLSGVIKVEKNKAQLCSTNAKGKLSWSKPWSLKKTTMESSDTWAKAAAEGMSAAFGKIENNASKPVTIVAAKSPYAKAVQLHEVVMKDGMMVMQEKKGGFTVKPGETLELKPGGNHLMFIGLNKTIKPGTTVPITLYTSDGGFVKLNFMGRNFAGANEEYPEGEEGGMPGHGSGEMPNSDSDKKPGNHMEGMRK